MMGGLGGSGLQAMNIIVVGAGTVGQSVAQTLVEERHDVTLIDIDETHLHKVEEQLDVQTIAGSGASAPVLFQAGVSEAGLAIAVTNHDEVNLIAASVAKEMGAKKSVARVHASDYRDPSTFDYGRHFRIDRIMNLEELTAFELAKFIRNPGSVAVETLARGQVEMPLLRVADGGPAVGKTLRQLELPRSVRVGALLRGGRFLVPSADHPTFQAGDIVALAGMRKDLDQIRDLFIEHETARVRVVIAGGGRVGTELANVLRGSRYVVRIIERDRELCEALAASYPHATVVCGDMTSRAFLEEERISQADVFVAATGEDEDNIMSAVEAKELGVPKTMVVIRRPDYANVVSKLGIDVAVSPRAAMAAEVSSLATAGVVNRVIPLPG
ncbi:MAG TPA: Trk system potassium transporter TrkA, partial [Planctomycetaceae bacterium]|nr:Trk system potassium transporter TrkA [Planctomycetaceae bacterium]